MSQSGKKEAMVTVKGLGATRHGGMKGLRQSTGHIEHCEPILYNAVMVDTITACLLKVQRKCTRCKCLCKLWILVNSLSILGRLLQQTLHISKRCLQ